MSNTKHNKSYASIARMVKHNTMEGHMQKNEVVLEPGWISDTFELREPEFYKLATTVARDDESPNIYTLPVGRCGLQTSVYESEYKDIHQNALIFPGGYI